MTHKDINNSKILIVVTGSSVSSPIRLTPSTPDAIEVLLIIIQCLHWMRRDATTVTSGVDTCYLTLCDSKLVGVCWGSVNMTVIFNKILNPTANLFVGVCRGLSVQCELALRHCSYSA